MAAQDIPTRLVIAAGGAIPVDGTIHASLENGRRILARARATASRARVHVAVAEGVIERLRRALRPTRT